MLVLGSIGENYGGGTEWNGSSNHRDEPLQSVYRERDARIVSCQWYVFVDG